MQDDAVTDRDNTRTGRAGEVSAKVYTAAGIVPGTGIRIDVNGRHRIGPSGSRHDFIELFGNALHEFLNLFDFRRITVAFRFEVGTPLLVFLFNDLRLIHQGQIFVLFFNNFIFPLLEKFLLRFHFRLVLVELFDQIRKVFHDLGVIGGDVRKPVGNTDKVLKGAGTHENIEILVQPHRALLNDHACLDLFLCGIDLGLIILNPFCQILDLLFTDRNLTVDVGDFGIQGRRLRLVFRNLGRIVKNVRLDCLTLAFNFLDFLIQAGCGVGLGLNIGHTLALLRLCKLIRTGTEICPVLIVRVVFLPGR